ncbi:unnamed protein product [Enterobius vermicularis]|uniref:POT1PC domain-containing protein n=1 Tax=Enterobius vermicularis TaxID=51028 RepID=A0A158QA24_ENTVE|nr:unnamed protein product [Enterobius vermicularis]
MADVRAVVPLEYTQFKFMRKFEYYNVVVQVCLLFVDDFKTYVYKWSKGPKVIGLMVTERSKIAMRCWDGTEITWSKKLFRFEVSQIKEVIVLDPLLEEKAGCLAYDIVLFGDHGDKACRDLKAGDVIVIRNLHVSQPSGSGLACLTLHDGENTAKFNRGFTVLSDDDNLKIKFLNVLSPLVVPQEDSNVASSSLVGRHLNSCNEELNPELLSSFDDSLALNTRDSFLCCTDASKRLHLIHSWQLVELAYLFSGAVVRNSYWCDALHNAVIAKVPFFIRSLVESCRVSDRGRDALRGLFSLNALRSAIIGTYLGNYFVSLLSRNFPFSVSWTYIFNDFQGTWGRRGMDSYGEVFEGFTYGSKCLSRVDPEVPITVRLLEHVPAQCAAINSKIPSTLFYYLVGQSHFLESSQNLSSPLSVVNADFGCLSRRVSQNYSTDCACIASRDLYRENVFLFPIGILHMFGIEIPCNAMEAVQKWKEGLTEKEEEDLAGEIHVWTLKKLLRESFAALQLQVDRADPSSKRRVTSDL